MKNCLFFTVFILVSVLQVSAQRTVDHQNLYWVKYQAVIPLSEQWRLKPSIEDRRYFEGNRQHMWLFTLDADRKLKNGWMAGVGFTRWTILLPSDPDSEFEVTQGEWRPYEYLTHSSRLSERFTLSSRYLMEERIRKNVGVDPVSGAPVIQDGYFFHFRFRMKAQIEYRLTPADASVPVHLAVYDELLVQFGTDKIDNIFDQNRISGLLKVGVGKQTDVSLGYINWYQQAPSGSAYVQRNILTLLVNQKF